MIVDAVPASRRAKLRALTEDMPRQEIADDPGLTIASGPMNADVPGNLRHNRSTELAAHCAAQSLRAGSNGRPIQNGASQRPPAAAITRPDGERRSYCDVAMKRP